MRCLVVVIGVCTVFYSSSSAHVPWVAFYQSAVLEPDDTKLPSRIAEARNAILDRVEELAAMDEREALEDALRVLKILDEITAKKKKSPGVVRVG
jgi:hypothetical protein